MTISRRMIIVPDDLENRFPFLMPEQIPAHFHVRDKKHLSPFLLDQLQAGDRILFMLFHVALMQVRGWLNQFVSSKHPKAATQYTSKTLLAFPEFMYTPSSRHTHPPPLACLNTP